VENILVVDNSKTITEALKIKLEKAGFVVFVANDIETIYFYIEEKFIDFFAVIAENFGFIGSFVFLGVYVFFFYRLFVILRFARTDFGKFLTLGVIVYIFSQLTINIGMNIGLMPITGVPLPFVSAGGSSLVSAILAVGIVQSVYIHDRSGA
jgi:rod shape determining protein RodA